MADLSELMERVEKATGPDRELDGLIARLEGWTLEKMAGDQVPYWRKPGVTDGWNRTASGPPKYTSSVDAALALVERMLPGCIWQIHHQSMAATRVGLPHCSINPNWSNSDVIEVVGGDGVTPPLAILTALLRTLSTRSPK